MALKFQVQMMGEIWGYHWLRKGYLGVETCLGNGGMESTFDIKNSSLEIILEIIKSLHYSSIYSFLK